MAKVRKQLYIEPEQEATLKLLASELGISEAALVREAIDCLLEAKRHEHDADSWERIRTFIMARMEQGPVEGGRNWKREDLYDRTIFH